MLWYFFCVVSSIRFIQDGLLKIPHTHIHTPSYSVNVGELLSKDKTSYPMFFLQVFIILFTTYSKFCNSCSQTLYLCHRYTFIVPNEKTYLSSEIVFVGWVLANTHSLFSNFALSLALFPSSLFFLLILCIANGIVCLAAWHGRCEAHRLRLIYMYILI